MKQLTCEMCGSTEMLKQNGVFVCQTCGTKYSVEEARKMMNEGAIEGQGTINVHNAAQLENLLNLARNSFNSKNYAQAEAFCNQIIARNDKHYEAWKLKGESINFQISATNLRILEVYNCIMTSYRVLDSKQKEEKRHDILASLKTCFEGEVEFWLQQFEANRPTEASLLRVKNAYIDACNKMSSAFDELGLSTEKESYLRNFDNDFIDKANRICVSAWRTTVGYNYYRDDLDVLGRNWGRGNAWSRLVTTNTNLYRPLRKQFDTFLDEGGNLIDLLQFAEQQFNTETPHQVKEDIFDNIIYFHRCLSDACWYEIGTSGYNVGWCFAGSLTDEAVDIRNNIISIYNGQKRLLKEEQEQEEEAKRQAERREFEKKLEKFKVECQSYEVNKLKEMAKDYFLKYQTDDGSACYDEYLEICSETIIKKESNCVSAYLCMLSYDPYRKQLKKLVENGVMPTENDKKYVEFYLNYVGEDAEPIFSWLLDNGYYWIVEYLIDLGLDVNVKDSCGKTALFSVAAYTCPEAQNSDVRNLAKKLLDAGADANITITDEKGTEISLLNRDTDPEIASMIVKKYPEIKQGRNSDGKMPKKYYVSIVRNIAIAVAVGIILIVSCLLINKANTYSDAVDLWEQGQYTDFVEKENYSNAVSLMNNGEYEKAIKVFEGISSYRDSQKQIEKCKDAILERDYQAALQLLSNKEYQAAHDAFVSLGDYSDSEEMAKESMYQYGLSYWNEKNYEDSNPIFESLGNYKDSKDKIHKHEYDSKITLEPACETEGITQYDCKTCSYSYTESIAATGHTYSEEITTKPTCEGEGLKTLTCDCGHITTATVAPTGHDYANSKVTKAATCDTDGERTVSCHCGAKFTEKIKATGHDYSSKITTAASCDKAGVKTFTCKCGKSYTESISPTGHTFVDATCEKAKYCKTCNKTEGSALGHDWRTYLFTYDRATCDRCDADTNDSVSISCALPTEVDYSKTNMYGTATCTITITNITYEVEVDVNAVKANPGLPMSKYPRRVTFKFEGTVVKTGSNSVSCDYLFFTFKVYNGSGDQIQSSALLNSDDSVMVDFFRGEIRGESFSYDIEPNVTSLKLVISEYEGY